MQQGCIKLIEGDSKDIYNYILNQLFCYFIHRIVKKMYIDFHKIKQHNCFLSTKSAYFTDFWMIMWPWIPEWWCWKFSFASEE